MSKVFNCGFGLVFLYESRALALQNIPKLGESLFKYNTHILNERYRLFNNQFDGNPRFEIQEGKRKHKYKYKYMYIYCLVLGSVLLFYCFSMMVTCGLFENYSNNLQKQWI